MSKASPNHLFSLQMSPSLTSCLSLLQNISLHLSGVCDSKNQYFFLQTTQRVTTPTMTSSTRTSLSSQGTPQWSCPCPPSPSPTVSAPPPCLLMPGSGHHPPHTNNNPTHPSLSTGPPSPVPTSSPCNCPASVLLQHYPRRSGAAPRFHLIRTGVAPRGDPSTRGPLPNTKTCRRRSCCTPRHPSPSSLPTRPCPRATGGCSWPSTWLARTQTCPLVHRHCLRRRTSTVSGRGRDGEGGCA